MDPTHVQEFLDVDHDVWTLGEAFEFPRAVDSNLHTKSNESQNVPNENMHFLSKEVWLDDNNPGLVTMHFVWKNRDSWMHVSTPSFQVALQDAFAKRFRHPYTVLRIDTLENSAIHRYSRFDCDMQLKAYEKSI